MDGVTDIQEDQTRGPGDPRWTSVTDGGDQDDVRDRDRRLETKIVGCYFV